MALRAPATEATGTAGASQAKSNFERLGWGVAENSTHDLGTDLFLMARDDRRVDLGLLVGAQVKSGPSAFRRPETDDTGAVVGWWFPESAEHFNAWLGHSLPHLLVLQDLETHRSYWVHITPETVTWTGRGAKILVPAAAVVDHDNQPDLLAVATSQRPALAWEGSAWDGAQQLAPPDALRWALILPRLIAPHPNAGFPNDLTPEQCIALVALVRIEELSEDRRRGLGQTPTMLQAADGPDFRWQLVEGLYQFVHDGAVEPLVDLARTAVDAADMAGGAVIAAAALLESGQAERAISILERVLDLDNASAVDQAWLEAQLARSYAETGRLVEARDLALRVQALRQNFPHDASATALAGSAARLVFQISDFGAVDFTGIIAASDSTAAWWRTQVLSWGLVSEAKQHFVAWSGGTPSDSGWSDLRAAALIAGFSADHSGWRHAISLAGRHRLLLTDPTSDLAPIVDALDALRVAGDERNLEAAAKKVTLDGPAQAAASLTGRLDLTRSTRTSLQADLILLTVAGDVTAEGAADRQLAVLLALLADPSGLEKQLHPTFRAQVDMLKAVRGLVASVSRTARRDLVEQIVTLTPEKDQLNAQRWAGVIAALPRSCWTPTIAARAAARAGEHDWPLEYALLAVASPHLPQVRERLLEEAINNHFAAVDALGEVRDIPLDRADQLLHLSLANLAVARSDAEATGGYAFGGTDWNWWLAVLSICFPDLADWDGLIGQISHPLTHPAHLTRTFQLLASHTQDIPVDRLSALADAVDQRKLLPDPWGGTGVEAARWASLALRDAAGHDDVVPHLLMGSPDDRQNAALLIGRRRDRTWLPALVALAFDSNIAVRAVAAHAVGHWASREPGIDQLHLLIDRFIDDPGTRIARRMMNGIDREAEPMGWAQHSNRLLTHQSAAVRRDARDLFRADG